MTTSLQPCPACSRHIRITEESCPFCAASVVGLLKAPAAVKFSGRMSRAALITATLAAVSACAGEDDGDDQGSGGAMSGSSGGSDMGTGGDEMGTGGGDVNVPVYGISPSGGAEQGTGGDAAGSGGLDVGVPEYGISPAGGNPGTGGEPATGTGGDIVGPVYGAPPVE